MDSALRTSNAIEDPFYEDLALQLQSLTLLQKLDALHRVQDPRASQTLGVGQWSSAGFSVSDAGIDGMGSTIAGVGSAAAAAAPLRMKGMDALTFDYRVEWPVSLVLSKKALTKYQFIFRHLLHIKHVESIILDSWMVLQSLRELNLGVEFSPYFGLRHRMFLFVQSISYYMQIEILEPNFSQLETQIAKATTVDEVIVEHDRFLDKCMKETLLTNPHLFKCLSKIMSTCQSFAENVTRIFETATLHQDDLLGTVGGGATGPRARGDNAARRRQARVRVVSDSLHSLITSDEHNYARMLQQFNDNFSKRVLEFMTLLLQQSYVKITCTVTC